MLEIMTIRVIPRIIICVLETGGSDIGSRIESTIVSIGLQRDYFAREEMREAIRDLVVVAGAGCF
jgi:hypothetical protein